MPQWRSDGELTGPQPCGGDPTEPQPCGGGPTAQRSREGEFTERAIAALAIMEEPQEWPGGLRVVWRVAITIITITIERAALSYFRRQEQACSF